MIPQNKHDLCQCFRGSARVEPLKIPFPARKPLSKTPRKRGFILPDNRIVADERSNECDPV